MLKLLIRCFLPLAAVCVLWPAAMAWGARDARPAVALGGSRTHVILGEDSLEPDGSFVLGGHSEAFPARATSNGLLVSARIYVGLGSTARSVILGIYQDRQGRPGTLLSSGSLAAPRGGAWNTVSLTLRRVFSGHKYWLSVLSRGGRLGIRRGHGQCRSRSSVLENLQSLPVSWGVGRRARRARCPISAYALAAAGTSPQDRFHPTNPSPSASPVSSAGLVSPVGAAFVPGPVAQLAPPALVAAPLIAGSPVVGGTLTSTVGSWSGEPTSYQYQWQDCDQEGDNCSDASDATHSSYTLLAGDVGHEVRVLVTATNAEGSTTASSAATGEVLEESGPPPPAPTNTKLPVLSGVATRGQTLSTTNGQWSGSPASYVYQWQDCNGSGMGCKAIVEATASTYTLVGSDVGHTVRVTVTATNAGGSAIATSTSTAIVAEAVIAPPTNTSLPTISGNTRQGQKLSSSQGTWSGNPMSYSYQWQRCTSAGNGCLDVGGATTASYTLQSADVSHKMRVVVSAANAGGSTPADSGVTPGVVLPLAPTNTALPVLGGTTTEGQTLSTGTGSWSGSPTSYSYQWQRCESSGSGCANVGGAKATTYTLTSADVNRRVRAVVTAVNAGGSTAASSAASAVIGPAKQSPPTNTALPSVSGTPIQGQVLSSTKGAWGGSPTSYSYQWQDCDSSGGSCSGVSGATNASYTLASADVGHTMRVVVTATNAGGATPASSSQSALVVGSTKGAGYPPCTQRLSQGANVASSLSSAKAGEVVCLNSGSYGQLTLSAKPSADVTLQAAPEAHVSAGAIAINGTHMVVRGLWIDGQVALDAGASNITLDHNDITGGGEGIVFITSDCTAPNAPTWSGCQPEAPVANVIISANHIHNIGQSGTEDAIHLDNWRNITISGNEFDHIVESGEHTDCLQSVYGGSELSFDHNYEHDNNCQGFFVKDGDASNLSFTENLFLRDDEPDEQGTRWGDLMQFWDTQSLTVEHNTIWDGKGFLLVAENAQNSPSATVAHNVTAYFSVSKPVGTPYSLTESYNIFGQAPTGLTRSSSDSVSSSPQFKNTATDDYRLSTNPNGIGIDWSPAEEQYGPIS